MLAMMFIFQTAYDWIRKDELIDLCVTPSADKIMGVAFRFDESIFDSLRSTCLMIEHLTVTVTVSDVLFLFSPHSLYSLT